MKTSTHPQAVAKIAKKGEKKQKQEELCRQNQERLNEALRSLEQMQGRTCAATDDGTLSCKETLLDFPSEEQLSCIMEFGSHDDIMKLIKAYAVADHIVEDESLGYRHSTPRPYPLPDKIGAMIAKRNNPAEISAFADNQGFGEEGQNILLTRGNHNELMWYLEKHGFLPEQQRKLIRRGNAKEIRQHILHHFLADELLDEMLNELKLGKTKKFYKFIAVRELPVQKQEAFLKTAREAEFLAYIERYGFWEQSLPCLARTRSTTELAAYINKHRYLGKGVYDLANRKDSKLSMFYVVKQCDTPLEDMIRAFSSVPNPDGDVLAKLYARIPRPKIMSEKENETLITIQDGMHSEVMAFLKEQKPTLSLFAEATLFFRKMEGEYEFYMNLLKWRNLENKIG